MEQYTRMDDLVISGLETTHCTYARAAAAGDKEDEDVPRGELHSREQQVIQLFNNKDIHINSTHICLPHHASKTNSRPNIIIRFVSRKHKLEVLKLAKKLKGTGVYVNQHLTKKNAEIARQLKIKKKVTVKRWRS